MRLLLISIGRPHRNQAIMFDALARELSDRYDVVVQRSPQARSLLSKVRRLLTTPAGHREAIASCDLLIVHSPAVLALRDIRIARALHKRLVICLGDIYPESANHRTTRIPRILAPLFRLMEGWCLRQADLVLVPSEEFRNHPSLANLPTIRIFPHGPLAAQDWPAAGDSREADPLRIAFAGQINDIRDLDGACLTLLQAFPQRIELNVFSEDDFDADARVRAAAAGRLTVVRRGFQPLDVLIPALASLDAGLVSLAPDYLKPASPSKLVTYLQAGLPVVYHGPAGCGLRSVISQYGLGVSLADVPLHAGIEALDRIRCGFPGARDSFFERVRSDRRVVTALFGQMIRPHTPGSR